MKRDLIFSLLTGALLSFAFPPLHLGFLAYFGLIPFFYVLEKKTLPQAIGWGYLTGLFVNLGTLYWINWVTVPGAIAAIVYLPVYYAVYAVLHIFLQRRIDEKYFYYCLPFLWTGMEFLRSLGVLGFPWSSLAYSQTYYLSLIQYSEYTSVFGVSFWIVVINVFILLILKNVTNIKKLVVYFSILVLLFILPWIYGKYIIPDEQIPADEKIRIGLVQGNIDPYMKWDAQFQRENLRIFLELTQKLQPNELDLIIWPETATPVYLRDSGLYLKQIFRIVHEFNVSLLTGTPDYSFDNEDHYKTFNSAFLFTPIADSFQVYRKMHLVPFGERVPFTDTFPFIAELLEKLEMGEGNFEPGDKILTFQIPKIKHISAKKNTSTSTQEYYLAPVIICFESLFPELVRDFVNEGADFLIIITNDAWFGRSPAPFHHAQIAVFRAIENRISIARCANTGVSMFIDEYGRTIESSSIFERMTLARDIPLRRETTFFTKHGHVFAVTVTLLNLVPLIFGLFKPSKKLDVV